LSSSHSVRCTPPSFNAPPPPLSVQENQRPGFPHSCRFFFLSVFLASLPGPIRIFTTRKLQMCPRAPHPQPLSCFYNKFFTPRPFFFQSFRSGSLPEFRRAFQRFFFTRWLGEFSLIHHLFYNLCWKYPQPAFLPSPFSTHYQPVYDETLSTLLLTLVLTGPAFPLSP